MRPARILLGAALVSLAAAAPAGAAVKAGAVFFGGTPPTSFESWGNPILMTAGVSDDGAQVELYLEGFAQNCGIGVYHFTAPLPQDGRVADTRTLRDRTESGARRTSAWTIDLSLQGNGGSGTAHLDLTIDPTQGKTHECSRDYVFELREFDESLEPKPGGPDAGLSYYGPTGQGYPFALRVSADAAKVVTSLLDVRLRCTFKGRRFKRLMHEVSPSGKIGAHGSFTIKENWTERFSNGKLRFRVLIRGTFFQHGVSGSATITSKFADRKTRKVTERCSSGKVTLIGLS